MTFSAYLSYFINYILFIVFISLLLCFYLLFSHIGSNQVNGLNSNTLNSKHFNKK